MQPPIGLALVRDAAILGAEPYFHDLIVGIEEVTLPAGYPVLLRVLASEADEERSYRNWAADGAVSGVLLVDLHEQDVRPRLITELGLPGVIVGPPVTDDVTTVWTDDDSAMQLVVAYLADQGHRTVLHVGGPLRMLHSRSRRTAFLDACERRGLAHHLSTGDYSRASGLRSTLGSLQAEPSISAAVYDSDLMALGGLEAASQLTLSVPADLAVVAWDDSTQAQLSTPALTAVSRDTRAVGHQIGSAMLRVLQGASPTLIHAPAASLRVRGSSRRDQSVT